MPANTITSLSSRPVIIGAGLAGLTTALALAPMPVVVLSAKPLGMEASSTLAQGGIAAALGAGDTSLLHAEDTIRAGAGLCDPDIVAQVTEDAPHVIERLMAQGVAFDHKENGELRLGLEGAHSVRRVVHAGGDSSGRAIMRTLLAAVQMAPSIEIIENATVTDLLVGDNGINSVAFACEGRHSVIATNRVVLATGGTGALWHYTTNPPGSWGQGLVLAARAGALLGDLEFMQFHPTVIAIGRDPMPLASEALRGEGAQLVDETGARFTAELASRDIVARAIWQHMSAGHEVFLDARSALGDTFIARFPAIYAICKSAGIDPVRELIPVRPAAHYHMGGVMVDAMGRSMIEGLWACGEAASTGLHGANRLASNSLLEAASFGYRVAQDIKGSIEHKAKASAAPPVRVPASPDVRRKIREIMSTYVGVLRDKEGLETASRRLAPLAEDCDMALAGLLIATAALRREESRGSHARTDFPAPSDAWAHRQILSLADVMHSSPRQSLSA